MPCFFHRIADKKIVLFAGLFFISRLFLAAESEASPPTPVFANDERIEQSVPYLTLEWEIPEESDFSESLTFQLEEAASDDFSDPSLRYEGPDSASVVSGLAEGEYYFRVRSVADEDDTSAWSDPVHVTIEYDSLAKAFLLFGIGAVVSIATVVLVITGDRRTRREEANAREANRQ